MSFTSKRWNILVFKSPVWRQNLGWRSHFYSDFAKIEENKLNVHSIEFVLFVFMWHFKGLSETQFTFVFFHICVWIILFSLKFVDRRAKLDKIRVSICIFKQPLQKKKKKADSDFNKFTTLLNPIVSPFPDRFVSFDPSATAVMSLVKDLWRLWKW